MSAPVFAATLAGILMLTLFVFFPAVGNGFLMDDHGQILNNQSIQTPGHLLDYFHQDVWGRPDAPSNYYRPIFVLWLRLHYVLYGLVPAGWHVGSVLVHLVNCLLLGLFAWRLLHDRAAAALSVALFALHPAHVESVAYVSAAPDLLMTAAILLGLLCHARWAGLTAPDAVKSSPACGYRWEWLLAAFLLFLLALLSKEPAVLLPLVFFALSAAQAARGRLSWTRAFLAIVPFLAVLPAYLYVRKLSIGAAIAGDLAHLPASVVILSLPATMWFYLVTLVWPMSSRAFANSPLTDRVTFAGVVAPLLGVLLALVLVTLLVRWILRPRGGQPPAAGLRAALWASLLLIVLPLLPALNLSALIENDVLHGRYAYLPTAGLALLAACAWHRLVSRDLRAAMLAVAAAVLLGSAALTLGQQGDWKDDLSAWSAAYAVAPDNALVLQHLSSEFLRARRVPEALPVARNWARVAPQNWRSWATTAECYMKLGRFAEAEAPINRAAELNRDDPRVHMEQSIVRERLGH